MEEAISQQGLYKSGSVTSDYSDRRTRRSERRKNTHRTAVQAIYRRRRNTVRRASDSVNGIYVDTHETHLWYLSTGLMLLCVFDAFFTTILITHGSEELNPLLDYLLQIDLSLFLGVKFLVTGLCISFLVLHKHHRLFNTVSCYHLLVGSVFIYAVLICYELSMLRFLPLLH